MRFEFPKWPTNEQHKGEWLGVYVQPRAVEDGIEPLRYIQIHLGPFVLTLAMNIEQYPLWRPHRPHSRRERLRRDAAYQAEQAAWWSAHGYPKTNTAATSTTTPEASPQSVPDQHFHPIGDPE